MGRIALKDRLRPGTRIADLSVRIWALADAAPGDRGGGHLRRARPKSRIIPYPEAPSFHLFRRDRHAIFTFIHAASAA